MSSYIDFCKDQAEKLFTVIDQHQGLLQWQQTWQVQGCGGLPSSSNGFYRGINSWSLFAEQIDQGYQSAIWLTFNQIKQKGGHVLKGAKGTKVCFFQLREKQSEDGEDDGKMGALFKVYTVFNLDQTSLKGQPDQSTSLTPEKIKDLLDMLGVNISEFGNQPRYRSKDDVIVMPRREHFNKPEDYDVTLLHELVHWTGHESRLKRDTFNNYQINNAVRAEEELIAEIGSMFLASHFGIAGDLLNHASYVESWKKLLDAKAVGRAISQASKAFSWLVGHLESASTKVAA